MTLELQVREDSSPAEARQYSLALNGTGAVMLGRGPESPVPLEGTRISRQHVAFSIAAGSEKSAVSFASPKNHIARFGPRDAENSRRYRQLHVAVSSWQ